MNSASGIASSSFGRVVFDGFAVCQDYALDQGRLYSTRGSSGEWILLGPGAWVYPDPEKRRVSIKGAGGRTLDMTEDELDSTDALQFARRLHGSGYEAEKGHAWHVLDYVRTAVAKRVAVTPFGIRKASCWPDSIFREGAGRPWRGNVPERAGCAGMAR